MILKLDNLQYVDIEDVEEEIDFKERRKEKKKKININTKRIFKRGR